MQIFNLFFQHAISQDGEIDRCFPCPGITLIGSYANQEDALRAMREDCQLVFQTTNIAEHLNLSDYAVWDHGFDAPPCGFYFIIEVTLGKHEQRELETGAC